MSQNQGQKSPLDAFLAVYWHDHDAGEVRPLADYLALFPGDEARIAREFLACESPDTVEGSSAATPSIRRVRDDWRERRIGPYRLIREIGRGGQAVVYLAEDTRLERLVALKLLEGLGTVSAEVVERLRREAAVASKLEHPGICTVFESGAHHAVPY